MPSMFDEHDLRLAKLGGYTITYGFWVNSKISLFFNSVGMIMMLSSMYFTTQEDWYMTILMPILSMIPFSIYYFLEVPIFKECYQKGLEIEERQRSDRQEKHMQRQKENEEIRRANEIKTQKAKEEKRKSTFKKVRKCIETGGIGKLKQALELIEKLEQEKQSGFMFGEAIVGLEEKSGIIKELETEAKTKLAKQHERLMEFDEAAEIYKELELEDEVIKVRKLKSEQGAVKVTQKVVHGDEVTKTEIKDSVLNRSNVGAGGDDKLTKIKELKELHDAGAIDDDEFKQMKKEILEK